MKRLAFVFAAMLSIASCKPAVDSASTHAQWVCGSTVYEMNVRQITPEGTFAAAAALLPELKENGVDIVWLMPVNPIGKLERKGTLGSYYAPADYKAVNSAPSWKRRIRSVSRSSLTGWPTTLLPTPAGPGSIRNGSCATRTEVSWCSTTGRTSPLSTFPTQR